MTNGEFEKIQEHYWTLSNRELGRLGAAASTFQLSMIARVDDTAKFREADLAAYPLFPEFGVIAKLPWSNNVYDEHAPPPQVLFGAMNLGLWLEYHYKLNPGDNEFIFGYQGLDDPI